MPLHRAAEFDVVVVGLGTMGSMALWRLSQRPGIRVLGVEQFGAGHANGASAGESRLFRTAYHEGAAYVPMLLRARELWHELQAAAARPILLEIGTLSIGREDDQPMRNVLDSVTRHDLPHEILTSADLHRRYPQHRTDKDTVGILDLLGGALRPEQAVLGALHRAEQDGAEIAASERVLEIGEPDNGAIEILTDRRRIRTRRVVTTTGAWARQLQPALARKVEIVPLLLTWFLPRDLSAFAPGLFPTFIRDEHDVHLFGAPTVDNYTVKVSPARFLDAVVEPAETPGRIDPSVLSEIGRQAQMILEGIGPEPVRYSLHPELFTSNKVPIIDVGLDGHVVTLTGFSGHGFKFAPLIGDIAAGLALDGSHPLHGSEFTIDAHPDLESPRDA